jgi:hypothetical protein
MASRAEKTQKHEGDEMKMYVSVAEFVKDRCNKSSQLSHPEEFV